MNLDLDTNEHNHPTNNHKMKSVLETNAKDMTAEEYRKVLVKIFPDEYPPEVGVLTKGTVFHNPPEEEHTGDRVAFGGIPWIEYRLRLLGLEGNHLQCSFCGRVIFIDVDYCDAYFERMNRPLPNKEDYQAVGGHYHKNRKDNTDGYIIIPVCKECNAKSENFDLVVKEPNKYVEEIGASVKEHEL